MRKKIDINEIEQKSLTFIGQMTEEEISKIRQKWDEQLTPEKADQAIVESEQYLNWIYTYIRDVESVDSDSASYIKNELDRKNALLISKFMDYVEELSEQQRVLIFTNNECSFSNEDVAVKIKDKFFDLFRMYGQGTYTCVSLLPEEPKYCYVRM